MTRSRDPEGTPRTPAPFLFALGAWRMRATAVLRKDRRRLLQQFLLIPPPGYSGRARISVIDGHRRDEFVGSWRDGRDPSIPAKVRSHLERLTGRLFREDTHPVREALTDKEQRPRALRRPHPAPPSAETPAVFWVPVQKRHPRTLVHANLLLEPLPPRAAEAVGSSSPILSGSITFARARGDATVYLAPILGDEIAEPANRAQAIAAALQALERDAAFRLGLPQGWAPAILDRGLEERVRLLVGSGQLEILPTTPETAASGALLDLPFLSHTGLATPQGGDTGIDPLSGWKIRNLLIVAPGLDFLHALSNLREVGATLRLATQGRETLTHVVHPMIEIDPLADASGPYTASLLHQLMRESIRIATADRASRSQLRSLNLCPIFLNSPHQWQDLARRVKRWNRSHLSPRIVLATPSDYFTMIVELEDRGMIRPCPVRAV